MKNHSQKVLTLYISFSFIFSPLYGVQRKVKLNGASHIKPLHYKLRIDKPNNRVHTNIKTAPNGVPIVNIGRLNSNKVSHKGLLIIT